MSPRKKCDIYIIVDMVIINMEFHINIDQGISR